MNQVLTNIFLPFAGAFLVLGLPKRYKGFAAAAVLGATFLISIISVCAVFKSKEIYFTKYFFDWFQFSFLGDGLSVFMALVSSFVALLIAVYSLDYMEHYEEKGGFYFWMVFFVASMMGLIFSANLLLMFCFWEMTSVCSWKLIGFHRSEKDLKAADKAFLVTFFGASVMLIGIALIYLQFGSLEINSLKGLNLALPLALFLLVGILSKSAQLPLQTWLPDAGVAPTPVTALLHAAVLVKIGIYVFARLFGLTFAVEGAFFNTTVIISVATIIVGAAGALVENNMKRILAYSTISQLGYILLALAINTSAGFQAALLYILAHSLAKAGLFLCVGIVEHKTGTKNINDLGGLLKTMPLTGAAYILCAFSVIGIPPFLGFWPKFMTILLTIKAGYLMAGVIAVLGALFTLFYLMRLYGRVFLGELNIKAEEDKNSPMVWIVLLLGILSLLLGTAFWLPVNLITKVMQ